MELEDQRREHGGHVKSRWEQQVFAGDEGADGRRGGYRGGHRTPRQSFCASLDKLQLTLQKESEKTFVESEEAGYRLLLKEVIESRGGGSGGADLTHLRREKKKKREAERGGSKGRKLRYVWTIHS